MPQCPKCGKEMVVKCDHPGCDAEVVTYSRIVGYMRPVSNWNPGKQQEFEDRKEYTTWGESNIARKMEHAEQSTT